MTGETVGHYRILEQIGAGGMGVVYKARDLHLDRAVAIKVIAPDKIGDPARTRRFVQEAKAASALNHPNIITIHDVTEHDGTDFIVMEYVEGDTLARAIARGPVRLNDVFKLGAQIASALERAHAAGIVHRDLKPANVMVTPAGSVKILDFGLAKLTEPASDADGTRTAPVGSEPGLVLGTAAYMAPEQAEGKPVDARADIFAFGAVLYEMVTGRRAFQSDSTAGTLAAVLRSEPRAVRDLVADVPPDVEKLVARCLRKDPDRRPQHMSDVRLALEDLKAESDSGALQVPVAPRRRPRFGAWAIGAIAVIALAAASFWIWSATRPKPLGAPVLKQLTTDTGLTIDPALSRDGKLLAYASDRSGDGNLDIWVRQIGGGEPMRLTHDPANERDPAFSPDGTLIAFRSVKDGGGIYVVSTLGGSEPRKIAPNGSRPRFSPDGSQIAYWTGGIGGGAGMSGRDGCQIFVVAATGDALRRLRADFLGAAYPEWTPDGRHLLFLGNRDEKLPVDQSLDWWVTPLDDGPAISTGALKATRGAQMTGPFQVYPSALITPVWELRSNALIFSASSGDSTNLWRIGISPDTWKVRGVPERLTSSPAIEQNPAVASGAGDSVTVAFATRGENSDIWSLPLEVDSARVTGELRQLTKDSTADLHARLSADGRKMVWVSARSGAQQVWVKDLETGRDRVLTASPGEKYSPTFSPDATRVSFSTIENSKWNVYVIPAAGGAQERLCEDCGAVNAWSPDGRYVMGNGVDGRVYAVEVASRRRVDLVALSPRWFCCPDIRLLAGRPWISFKGGVDRMFLAPFKGETPPPESSWISWDVSWDGWLSPDGTLLYGDYQHDGFTCIGARRFDQSTGKPTGSWIPVFHSHAIRVTVDGFSVARGRIVLNMVEHTGNIWMATWKDSW